MWRGEGFFFGSTRSVSRRRNDDHDDDDGQKQPTRESVRCPFLVGDGGSREGGAPASRPRGSRPRARLDAHLLLRQAERHQQALPQPHAGVGGGRSAGACAPRARVWGRARSAAARHASARLRFQLDRRGVGRARARKKGGSRRGRIQFAPTPPVYPRHASPKWAAITGAANATDTGCVAFDPRRAAFCDTPRAVDREIPPRRLPPIHPIRATRKHSMSRALDRRPVALVTSFPLTTSSPVFSHTFSPPYTRRRMAVTTAAAAAAGSALPR